MTWTQIATTFLVSTSFMALSSVSWAMMGDDDPKGGGAAASSASRAAPLEPTEEQRLQAGRALFKEHLKQVAATLPHHVAELPTIFLSYSWENDVHMQRVEALALDLKTSGIPLEKILLDRWASRPGSGVGIFQHADKVSKTDKVIMIGSPGLPAKYEGREGVVSQELDNLRSRLKEPQKGAGIILVWFEGGISDNIPVGGFHALPGHSLGNYFVDFFGLLENIYQLDPTDNFIAHIKNSFIRRRQLAAETIINYAQRRLEHAEREAAEDAQIIDGMLAASLEDSEKKK